MSSSHLEDLILEILRLSRRMRREAGRGPSAAELAGYLHLPLAEVRAALARAKDLAARAITEKSEDHSAQVPAGLIEALTLAEERLLLRQFGVDMELVSLKTPNGKGQQSRLGDLIGEVGNVVPRPSDLLEISLRRADRAQRLSRRARSRLPSASRLAARR